MDTSTLPETTPLQRPTRPPSPGEMVLVRSRRWLVEEVVNPEAAGTSCLVRLACADDDAQGAALDVYWDFKLV